MKKLIVFLAIAAMLTLTLMGCGGSSGSRVPMIIQSR